MNPCIYHLHVFGCKCFILNNKKDNLGTFDAKADRGLLLGYFTSIKLSESLTKEPYL